jgi:hypothetical protein
LEEDGEPDSGKDAAEHAPILSPKELENADNEEWDRAKDDDVKEYSDLCQAMVLRCLAATSVMSHCGAQNSPRGISVQSVHQHQHDTNQRRETYAVDDSDEPFWGPGLVIHELQDAANDANRGEEKDKHPLEAATPFLEPQEHADGQRDAAVDDDLCDG